MFQYYIGNLFIANRWYLLMGINVMLFVTSFFFPFVFQPAIILFTISALLTLGDYVFLFLLNEQVSGNRVLPKRLSLGDENNISYSLYNTWNLPLFVTLVDEYPEQLQLRDLSRSAIIKPKTRTIVSLTIRPLSRGEYIFGRLLCFVQSPLRLLERRIVVTEEQTIRAYPSFQQMRRYQLLATSDITNTGIKKVRRLGHSMEFEKIKEYVTGDDVRTINWKATARKDTLMVNMFTDARQQAVYALIDKSRSMKMPFDGLTLLDHSINATLTLLNVALLKQDRAGLISFTGKDVTVMPAEKRSGQLNRIMETLYNQQTDFKESDYEQVWTMLHRKITQRSFLLLFTNFETMAALERQLPYLRKIAQSHLLCVVFFENTLLKTIQENHPDDTEGIYIKTIADRFGYEKKQIVKELRRHGIISILTTPAQLTVDVINKYLELKSRQMV